MEMYVFASFTSKYTGTDSICQLTCKLKSYYIEHFGLGIKNQFNVTALG